MWQLRSLLMHVFILFDDIFLLSRLDGQIVVSCRYILYTIYWNLAACLHKPHSPQGIEAKSPDSKLRS